MINSFLNFRYFVFYKIFVCLYICLFIYHILTVYECVEFLPVAGASHVMSRDFLFTHHVSPFPSVVISCLFNRKYLFFTFSFLFSFSIILLSSTYIYQINHLLFLLLQPHLHCKLTRRRRSNSIDITVTTLWQRCFYSSGFTCKCNK